MLLLREAYWMSEILRGEAVNAEEELGAVAAGVLCWGIREGEGV